MLLLNQSYIVGILYFLLLPPCWFLFAPLKMKRLMCACGKGEMETGCVGNVPVCVCVCQFICVYIK